MVTKIKNDDPIFIVGCPRSGTTILASILNRHSNLAAATETHFFNFVASNGYDWKKFSANEFQKLIQESRIQDFIKLAEIKEENLIKSFDEIEERKKQSTLDPEDFYKKSVFDMLAETLLKKKKKQRLVEKTPQHLNNIKEILKLYPQAKIIHVVRDGRDTVNSLLKMPWRPKGLLNNARFWAQYSKLGKDVENELIKSQQMSENFITIRYEDIVSNAQATIEKVCSFIEEDFDSNMLEKQEGDETIFSQWESSWKSKSTKNLDSSRIGAWANEMQEDEKILLEWALNKTLLATGYQSDKPKLSLKHYWKIFIEYLSLFFAKLGRSSASIIN